MTTKPEIHYMLCIGFRCLTTDIMKKNDWRKFTGPFDEMYIDIETVFETISTDFDSYLTDIVEYYPSKSTAKLYFPNKTSDLHSQITALKTKQISYLAHNYMNNTHIINQNYIETNNSGNYYDWSRICVFHHQNLVQKDIHDKLTRRIQRTRELFQNHSEHLLLFGTTRIISSSLHTYIQYIVERKQFYKIPYKLCLIVYTDKVPEKPYDVIEECLFIYQQCYSYHVHYTWSRNGIYADNNGTDVSNCIEIIKNYYQLNLFDKNTLSI
jgi:hypothetical protein